MSSTVRPSTPNNFAAHSNWVGICSYLWLFQNLERNKIYRCLTFCWPCTSVYLSQELNNFIHKICFTISFISCLYMFRAYVLIMRNSKLRYTASGIITLKQVSGLKLLKHNSLSTCAPDGHLYSKHVLATAELHFL